jgi:hypothetical protein
MKTPKRAGSSQIFPFNHHENSIQESSMRTTNITRLIATMLIALATVVLADESPSSGVPIPFSVEQPGRVSLAVYDKDGVQLRSLLVGEWLQAGSHEVRWDGLDRDGRAVEPGKFEWKLVSSAGIEADYLGALGANPKAGGWTKWVGNHTGPSTIAVGSEGIVVGAPIAEGPPSIHMFEPDFSTSRWLSPHLGWGAFGARSVGMTDKFVVGLRQDAQVTVRDVKSGNVIKMFDVLWADDKRPDANGGQGLDIDASGGQCVVSHFDHDAVRWYELPAGKVVREVAIAKPKRVASVVFRSAKERGRVAPQLDAESRSDSATKRTFAERKATIGEGSVFVLAERGVVLIDSDNKQTLIIDAKQLVQPVALAWDASNQTLLVANGEPDQRILRFSAEGKLLKTYGVIGGRKPGPYYADRFAEVADVAADRGRFYVVEGGIQGGLRRIAHVGEDGTILDERFGGAEFFACAAAVPGKPGEIYYSSSPQTIGRYDFDPETGKSRLTHLFRVPEKTWGDGLFPTPYNFPHYRPVVRNGQAFLVSNGRFILRPVPETGELIPVALASFRRNNGWPKVEIPEPIAKAAEFHKLDVNSPKTDAFTWSDTNGNGQLDPEEFRFAETGPGAGYAFLDDDFNVLFGFYQAPNHTWTGKNWINFEFQNSLYATLPNDDRNAAAPSWDWKHIVRSTEKIPEDSLGILKRLSPRAIHKSADGRINVFFDGGGGGHLDLHTDAWPTAQTTHTRVISAHGGRITHVVGKHASEGPPRDAQFGMPSHLLGTVNGHLIVCDRMQYTTAWTSDGLLIGTLLDRHVNDELPDAHYVPGGKHGEQSVMMGDDWMSAGSISDLGDGEAVWFAPGGDRVMAFKLRGFNNLTRQSGSIDVPSLPKAASVNGDGLKAEYFSSVDLSGQPVVSRVDPRLWFSESTTGRQMVAAWTKDGPCPGIAAGKPFSARWTGSITAPYSEPFWFRIYNARPGHGHTPMQQGWLEEKGFVRVWLNNQLVLDKWNGSPATNAWQTPPLMLQAGATYDLRVEYSQTGVAAPQFSLSWCSYTGEWLRVPTQYLHSTVAKTRPRVSIAATQPLAAEQDSKPGVVRFTLDRSSDKDIEIAYRLSGTAKPGSDFQILEQRAVIRAGQTSTEITNKPLDDEQLEANENCFITLLPSPDFMGDGTAGQAVVTIKDNDNVLVDVDCKVYYTFDGTDLESRSIRNEAGADHAAVMHTYGAPPPRLVASMPNYSEALTFPNGRESVGCESKLELGDYSVSFWFRTTQSTTGICMVGSASYFLKDGTFQVIHSGWPSSQPAGANLADDNWHHAAFVWHSEPRQQKLFIDGQLIATNTGPGGNTGLTGTITLGRANSGGSFKDGHLDEFRVYSRRLTAEEISRLSKWRR